MKALGLDIRAQVQQPMLLQMCHKAGIRFREVCIGHDGSASFFVRGVRGEALLRNGAAYNDGPWCQRKGRLVLLRWYTRRGSVHVAETVHLVKRVDTAKRSLLFEKEICVRHPPGQRVHVRVLLGPWTGIASDYFGEMTDPGVSVRHAERVLRCLSPVNLLQQFMRPSEFSGDGSGDGQLYAAFAGPGVGKTTRRLADVLRHDAEHGQHAILACSLSDLRNRHVDMLRWNFGDDLFAATVRVVGSNNLDALAKSRTLSALVGQRIQPEVLQYEDQMGQLVDCTSRVGAVKAVSMRLQCLHPHAQDRRMSLNFHLHNAATLIASFADVHNELSEKHASVAKERCRLCDRVRELKVWANY